MDSQKIPFMGNDELSIKKKPVKTLDETLELMTPKQLEVILETYNMPEEPEFKTEAELKEIVKKLILENCLHFLFYEEEGSIEIFETFIQKRNNETGISEVQFYVPENKEDDGEIIVYAFKTGLIKSFMNRGFLFNYIARNGDEYFVVPDEIYTQITEYKEADKDFGKWFQLTYFAKMLLSVYGVLTPEEFLVLWKHHDPECKFTREQLLEHFKFSSILDKSYFWYENLNVLADEYLDPEDASDILEERKKHSLFIPSKEIIEKWFKNSFEAESDYVIGAYGQFEVEFDNPFYVKMAEFLQKVRKKQDDWDEVLYELMICIKTGYFPSQTLEMLNQEFSLIEKMSKKDFGVFMATYQMLHNSSHIWTNYGWSPDELARHFSSMSAVMQNPIQNTAPFTQPDSDSETQIFPKVGRNDPCPCGSGKKYKNCHGK